LSSSSHGSVRAASPTGSTGRISIGGSGSVRGK
jgi:hypothetical protein